jgi:ribonuclease HI
MIKIYTDGACSGNPGKGGWGAILLYGDKEKRINGFDPETTNNKMELKAVIEALKIIKKNIKIEIHTDSIYVKDGITKWIFAWKKNDWKNSKKQKVKNSELWQELDSLVQKYDIDFFWVKGHNGDKYNEIADELARKAIEQNLHYHK